MNIKFSIVTVTLNCREDAVGTAKNVLEQNFDSFEYIIKDGGSTDGTIEQLRNLGIQVISQPDLGIYDAMNQALKYCSGEYVCFLNAGDKFIDSKVLTLVSNWLKKKGMPDFTYSDILSFVRDHRIESDSREIRYPNLITRHYLYRKMVCQQAWFVKRKILLQKGGFNINYKLLADYDFLLNLVLDSRITQSHIPLVSVVYKGGGASDIHPNVVQMEKKEIIQKYYRTTELIPYSLENWCLKVLKPWVYILYPYFPSWLKAKANGW